MIENLHTNIDPLFYIHHVIFLRQKGAYVILIGSTHLYIKI